MKGLSCCVSPFVRIKDYCWMRQSAYHNTYHCTDDGMSCQIHSAGESSCEGTDQAMNYWLASPLRNAMNRWGTVPGVACVVGLERWVFGIIELGVGGIGFLVGSIHVLGLMFLRIPYLPPYREMFLGIFDRGASDFWQGIKEVISCGCHRSIEAKLEKSSAWNGLKVKVLNYLPSNNERKVPEVELWIVE